MPVLNVVLMRAGVGVELRRAGAAVRACGFSVDLPLVAFGGDPVWRQGTDGRLGAQRRDAALCGVEFRPGGADGLFGLAEVAGGIGVVGEAAVLGQLQVEVSLGLLLGSPGLVSPLHGEYRPGSVTDVSELLDRIVDAHRDRAVEHVVILELERRGLDRRVDPVALRRVLNSLLANAAPAQPGRRQRHRCRRHPTCYRSRSRSRRRAITSGAAFQRCRFRLLGGFLPHVFDRFARADHGRGRASASGGSGIGLAWPLSTPSFALTSAR